MEAEEGLIHETRKKLMLYIADNPGTSFQTLKKVFLLNDGTLRYHLNYLRRIRRIKLVKQNNQRTYLPADMKLYADEHRRKLNLSQRRILKLIEEEPGISRKELLDRSRQTRKDLSYNLERLNELGLVWKMKNNGRTGFAPITKDELYKQAYAVMLEKLLDGEMDVDSFRKLKRKLDLLLLEED
ncbi:MAG: winged helix-turn-helix transcriptional regulator [Thermoplasmatota archaeon]